MRTLLAVLAAASLLLPTVSAGGGVGCGGYAPFIVECASNPFVWREDTHADMDLFLFVGTLEVRVEWAGGAYVLRCASLALDELGTLAVWRCEQEGQPPRVGTLVTLRCTVSEHPDAPLGPAGPWGCSASTS